VNRKLKGGDANLRGGKSNLSGREGVAHEKKKRMGTKFLKIFAHRKRKPPGHVNLKKGGILE